MHNLVNEPLIRYDESGSGLVKASLPEVYAALMADNVEAFPALRPHQHHAWHALLVQLGAMAVHRAGLSNPPDEPEDWLRIIRGLTPDFPNDEPWQLVVDDITKPAFMQPPARSSDKLAEYIYKKVKGRHEAKNGEKEPVHTPDKLDMLVTSKNHDLKSDVVIQAGMDDWIFALITLQTMEGYGGSGNHCISRMPSGYGNRPAFSLAPSAHPGAHFRHDLIALLNHRQTILDEYPMIDSGLALLWIIPWDGTEAEAKLINELEPFYIEVCRRVRLRWGSGKMTAVRANSDTKRGRRVEDVKGLTGDPWMPVSNNTNPKGTPPAFLTQRRFGYERVVDGLFSADWKQPFLLSPASSGIGSSGDMELVARGMVRGEGGTAGYHEKVIPLRHRTLQVFGRPGGREELGDLARKRVERIGIVEGILRHAVSVFAAGGKTTDMADEHRARANKWANKLDEIVDKDFFEDLQEEVNAVDGDRVHNEWLRKVIRGAYALLYIAADSLPCPSIHRYKARAEAERLFGIRIKQSLPFLFDDDDKESEE